MAKVNVSEAASLVGVARSTLYAYIRSGKISTEKDRLGKPQIDTSELLRVFGVLQDNTKDKEITGDTQKTDNENAALRTENEVLREMLKVREEQLREYQEREQWLRNRLDAIETKLLPGTGRPWWSRWFGSGHGKT
ncbi:helix-turn-helix domain-containing protein [Acidithiobacillus caldus]